MCILVSLVTSLNLLRNVVKVVIAFHTTTQRHSHSYGNVYLHLIYTANTAAVAAISKNRQIPLSHNVVEMNLNLKPSVHITNPLFVQLILAMLLLYCFSSNNIITWRRHNTSFLLYIKLVTVKLYKCKSSGNFPFS